MKAELLERLKRERLVRLAKTPASAAGRAAVHRGDARPATRGVSGRPLPPEARGGLPARVRVVLWPRSECLRNVGATRRTGDDRVPKCGEATGKDGSPRITVEAGTYIAKYRDGGGIVREVWTGCRDETAARAVLAQHTRRAELVSAGVVSAEEDAVADHRRTPLAEHFDRYIEHLRARDNAPRRIAMLRGRLDRLAGECGFGRLSDLSVTAVERRLVQQQSEGMAAATRNGDREALIGFGNWCRRTRRLTKNPFSDVPRADQNADRRLERRAMTENELDRLLKVARLRPLAEYGRETVKVPPEQRNGRRTWKRAPLTLDTIDVAADRGRRALAKRLERVADLKRKGWERGRSVDVHGMRTTFGTHLSKGGVPRLAPTPDESGASGAIPDKRETDPRHGAGNDRQSVSACEDKRKPPLTSAVHGGREKRVIGLEPTTFTLARGEHRVVSDTDKGLTEGETRACTGACTSDPENGHGRGSDVAPDGAADDAVDEQLAEVMDTWGRLPEAVRAGIVAMVRAAGA